MEGSSGKAHVMKSDVLQQWVGALDLLVSLQEVQESLAGALSLVHHPIHKLNYVTFHIFLVDAFEVVVLAHGYKVPLVNFVEDEPVV